MAGSRARADRERQPVMRAALYWVPTRHSPLFAAGSAWLGRDAETGQPIVQPEIPMFPNLAEATAGARRYGFHATLRPPMHLCTSLQALRATAAAIAARHAPFILPPLQITGLDGFLAITETARCEPLHALADDCVLATDPHRAPPSAAEQARRRAAGLTAEQEDMLSAHGYPYALKTWFFHLTLTRRLNSAEARLLRPAAEGVFAAALREPCRVEDIALCVEEGAGDFRLAERFALLG